MAAAIDPDVQRNDGDYGLWGATDSAGCVAELTRRLKANPRIVVDESIESLPLLVVEVIGPIPPVLADVLARVARAWTRPDGVQLSSAAQRAALLRNLATGFYYATAPRPSEEAALLQNWAQFVHRKTRYSRGKTDTEGAVRRAARAGDLGEEARRLEEATRNLGEERGQAVWLDHSLVEWVIEQYPRKGPVLWWFSSDALEEALRAAGLRHLDDLAPEDWGRLPALASIRRDGVGRNLQAWSRAIVLEPPVSGAIWEQLLGRLHRTGQRNPVTYSSIGRYTVERDAIRKGQDLAQFIAATTLKPQRMSEKNH
jgi:hypothetical protein